MQTSSFAQREVMGMGKTVRLLAWMGPAVLLSSGVVLVTLIVSTSTRRASYYLDFGTAYWVALALASGSARVELELTFGCRATRIRFR